MSAWITTHVAARLLGLTEHHFRVTYCRALACKVTTLENGQTGHRRRYKIFRPDIERMAAQRRQKAVLSTDINTGIAV
jgi:hypothetical protein